MALLLVAPPTLWGVEGVGKLGEWGYFDLQIKALGPAASTFPGEHLGLRSIQAYCREQGLKAEVVNGHVLRHLSLDETWQAICDVYEAQGGLEIVGFTGTLEMFEENAELARRVKAAWPDTLTVFGHDFASLNYMRLLDENPQFDIVSRGEGEIAFAELGKAVRDKRPLNEVPNIAFRSEAGEIVTNPLHPGLDLDSLPFPDRGDLPHIMEMGLAPAVFTSRGCLYRCNYCTTGQIASLLKGRNSYRMRSIPKVVDEIESLIREYDLKWLTIVDDLFVGNEKHSRERAIEFAEEMIRRGVKIDFKIDVRIDSIEEELFALLAKAGLKEIFVGIETASDEQLAFYGKVYDRGAGSQFDVIKSKLDIVHKLGISVSPGILTYHPTVTRHQLQLTAELLEYCNYRASYPLWSTITIYPGTPLYEEYRQSGVVAGEWPYLGWKFADKKAEIHYLRVKRAAKEHRFDYEAMRKAFLDALDKWDEIEDEEITEEAFVVM